MNVTVIYGSDSGITKHIAGKIANGLGGRAIDVTSAKPTDFEDCDLLVLGSSTYGAGELQADWDDHIGALKSADIAGRKVALFGTGDQISYSDTFVDAIGLLYDEVTAKGAQVVGFTDIDGYDFEASLAQRDGKFVGLALDEDNQSDRTERRIAAWIATLK